METCKYKSYLKEFNYPNIDIFNDEQIIDIFNDENRYFLLKWLVQNLTTEFVIPKDLSENSAALFADFFYERGFCTSSQKLLFVKGSKMLTLKEQIGILDRIFNFLKHTSEKENVESKHIISNESLQLFLHKDINLFPTLGSMKSYSLKERERKSKACKDEIQNISKKMENLENIQEKTNNDNFISPFEYSARQTENNIQNFKEEVMKLKEITTNAQIDKSLDESETKFSFSSEFGNRLADCNSKTVSVLQYYQNLSLIQQLNTKDTQEEKSCEENEIYKIVKQNIDTSVDILEMPKLL